MEQHTTRPASDDMSAALDPKAWTRRQHYGELKKWLKSVIWLDEWAPLIVPPTAIPISYLSGLLLQTDVRIKLYLRTIIPELLSEWTTGDSPDVLESLLILCGDLSCNEAEMIIDRIVTHKLGEGERDARCRSRALSTLQSIGTERTLHLFLRYIDIPRHTALCYRGLYRLNPRYAATQMPALIRSYTARNEIERLKDVLGLLFNETLTPPEYTTVLGPFAEEAEPESFVEVLNLLQSIGVFSQEFFACLSSSQSVDIFGVLLRRARAQDCEKIVSMLSEAGMTIEPPPDVLDLTSFLSPSEKKKADSRTSGVDNTFYLVPKFAGGAAKRLALVGSDEVEENKRWSLTRGVKPRVFFDEWAEQPIETIH